MKRCFPLHDSIHRFETERDKRPILRRGQQAEWILVSTKGRYQTSIPTEYRDNLRLENAEQRGGGQMMANETELGRNIRV